MAGNSNFTDFHRYLDKKRFKNSRYCKSKMANIYLGKGKVKGGIDTLQALFKVKVHNAFRRLNYCPDLAE